MDKSFEGAVLSAIRAGQLLCPGDRVIAAVSGGADSMALLQFLLDHAAALGITLEAVHVDHRLRPESGRVAQFVADVCAARKVRLHRFVADAPVGHRSEDWSRTLRYGFFEQLAGPGVKLATAHTLTDQAETLLFRLARGTGVHGARGIPNLRGMYIRPFLGVTKAQTEAYCAQKGLKYVMDADNLTDDYARNRLRHYAMPALESANPQAQRALGVFCGRMEEISQYLQRQGAHLLQAAARTDGYELALLAAAEPVELEEALRQLVQQKRPLREKDLPGLLGLVRRGRGTVQLGPRAALSAYNGLLYWQVDPPLDPAAPVPLLPGEYHLPGGFCLCARLLEGAECEESIKFAQFDKKLLNNCADYDKIIGSLYLRTRLPGDVYRPAGRNVSKTLKKYYNELGVPPDRRGLLPLAAVGGQVMWLWGQGFAHGLRPTAQTRRLLLLLPGQNLNAEELE